MKIDFITTDVAEIRDDREMRCNNIIIYWLPESNAQFAEEEKM